MRPLNELHGALPFAAARGMLDLVKWQLISGFMVAPAVLAASGHWAYQPVEAPEIDETSAGHPVDALIVERLDGAGLSLAPLVSARILIRRATWYLTGLPPTPEEVSAFLSAFERSPEAAYEGLIERLLASPRYGERWARHWLDLVRYADTAGDAADFPVPEASRYRNYVIEAFNEDKPYDQFIREQIAGDLLGYTDDDQRWEQTIATGYLAISRRIGVSPHNLKHITIEDTINNLGETFLGLTIGCARCHDHKFDAISTEDYYALYGFFESSVYPHAGAEHKPWRENFVYRIGDEKAEESLREHRRRLEEWRKRERAQFEVYRSFQNRVVTYKSLTRESTWNELLRIRSKVAEVANRFPEMEIAYAVRDGAPIDSHLQKAGSPLERDRGKVVRRGWLPVLGGEKLPRDEMGSGRRFLADCIASRDNTLTARVMVNRIWAHHFGRGLVATPSDFGVRGAPPTHPELLDYLAQCFMDSGWSVKAMHRLIMTSQAFRRASSEMAANAELDPDNVLLWRMNRRRLDAEQLRDGIKFLAGSLDLTPGRRHPFGHHLTYFYRQHEPFQEAYQSHKRSVYLMQQRLRKNPYLELFDGPDGNTPLSVRGESSTATQALYFMNSKFAHEESEKIARRIMRTSSQPGGRIGDAYRRIFGRPPSEGEVARATEYLSKVTTELGQPETTAWAGYVRGMISSNEFLFID